jgi:hypothetical protein
MTPVLDPPKIATRSTGSAAVTLSSVAFVDVQPQPEVEPTDWFDSSVWPEGIDYERWAAVVKPAPREAFADRLDVVDLLAD